MISEQVKELRYKADISVKILNQRMMQNGA